MKKTTNNAKPIDGLLVVDKADGPTSQAAVTLVKRALGAGKAGHTGTLDPFATGVLPVCLGRATKLASIWSNANKTYRVVASFGVTTDTQDRTGKVLETRDATVLRAQDVLDHLAPFLGVIEQVPPMFSAVKVDGQRLYKKARKGEVVARKPRTVEVHRFELTEFKEANPSPEESEPSLGTACATFEVTCSKGTYVRTLVADLGESLGVGGMVQDLCRMAVGPFGLDQAMGLETIGKDPAQALGRVIPLDQLPLPMESLALDSVRAKGVSHGIAPPVPEGVQVGPVALRGPTGQLLALAEVTPNPDSRIRLVRGI